jgi:hypothetical protein
VPLDIRWYIKRVGYDIMNISIGRTLRSLLFTVI